MSYIIVTAGATYGPYNNVETLPDRWLADGFDLQFSVVGTGTVQPANGYAGPSPGPTVPDQVTAFQAKAALTAAGLYDQVNTYLLNQAPAIDRIAWQEAEYFQRKDPIIASLMGPLGLTESQLDQLFLAAAQLSP